MAENVNSISLNAYDVWKKLDQKDGEDDTIQKPIWDAFRSYTGVKAKTINYAIKKENALKSIESYLRNSSDEVKQKIAEFCGLSGNQPPAQKKAEPAKKKMTLQTPRQTTVTPKSKSAAGDSIQKSKPVPSPNKPTFGINEVNPYSNLAKTRSGEVLQTLSAPVDVPSHNYGVSAKKGKDNIKSIIKPGSEAEANLRALDPIFTKAAAAHNIPKALLQAVCMQESQMGTYTKSGKNNIMQFTQQTAKDLYLDKSDREQSIYAAARYLENLIARTPNHNIARALVGYNRGRGSSEYKNWNGVRGSKSYEYNVLSYYKEFERMNAQGIS